MSEHVAAATDLAWSVEQHGIEPVPLQERHGKPSELFKMWVGANINYVVLLNGALAVSKGMTLVQSITAILVGNLLGCTVLGLASIMGPRTGTAGIVTSRTSFGQLGAMLPILLSTLSALGWFSINSVVATQSLDQMMLLIGLPAGPVTSWCAMLVVLAAEIMLAIYGHATIIAAEKYISLVLVVLFAGLAFILLPQVDAGRLAAAAPAGGASFATWMLVTGLIFSYPISWANFASDYSRYLPEQTGWKSIALFAGGGQFVALVFCELIGVVYALAVGTALSDPVADLPRVLPDWYVTPFLLAIIIGSVASNVPNGYTSGLGVLALRIPIRRVTSLIVIAGATLLFRIATLMFGHFFDMYEQWLLYIIIWTCPWVAIVVVDYFLRGGYYDRASLMTWGGGRYWYSAGLNVAGLLSFAVGLGSAFAFSYSDLYKSPLMGKYLGEVDLSVEAGIIIAAISYWLLARDGRMDA